MEVCIHTSYVHFVLDVTLTFFKPSVPGCVFISVTMCGDLGSKALCSVRAKMFIPFTSIRLTGKI